MRQYIVALTGGIGSGKTKVANYFAALGVPVIDTDVIAREIVQSKTNTLNKIIKHFGPEMLNNDGSLNRSALRFRIFSNPTEKFWLNSLLHPLIKQKSEQKVRTTIHYPYVLWVVPLLIENNLQNLANRVLVVDVDRELQIMRTVRRDGISREQVNNIIAAQVSRQQRLAYADDIIDNSSSIDNITNIVDTLHKRYLTFASSIIL